MLHELTKFVIEMDCEMWAFKKSPKLFVGNTVVVKILED